jgi:hypothetical protein
VPHRPLRILTWHVHGNYLYYLTQVPHEWYVVSKPGRPPGYAGRSGQLPWGANVHDLPADRVADTEIDCVVFQARPHYLLDRHELLSARQRDLPRLYIEHDPPQQHPTDTRHPVQDPDTLLIHVTHFNDLMWDNGVTPTRVIEHGVLVPDDVRCSGELDQGIVVVNNMRKRGRRLGLDLYRQIRREVPLTLIGMDAESEGGPGEVPNVDVPRFISRYRFFFQSCRYTSLSLAACEAMMIGMPIVAPATTEIVTVIRSGENGYIDTDRAALSRVMRELIADPGLARRWGDAARETALRRFSIERFVADWMAALESHVASRELAAA